MDVTNDLGVFSSVCRAYSESVDNILMYIRQMFYTIKKRRFTVVYLCVLFRADGVKLRSRGIFR
jgi:predicted nuclease of restriction endonuclease-like (RecB) superfamily